MVNLKSADYETGNMTQMIHKELTWGVWLTSLAPCDIFWTFYFSSMCSTMRIYILKLMLMQYGKIVIICISKIITLCFKL